MSKQKKAIKAAKIIRKYCKSHNPDCKGCVFNDPDNIFHHGCRLNDPDHLPETWRLKDLEVEDYGL